MRTGSKKKRPHTLTAARSVASLSETGDSKIQQKKKERGIPPVNFVYILWNKTSVAWHIQGQIYSRVCVCECVD